MHVSLGVCSTFVIVYILTYGYILLENAFKQLIYKKSPSTCQSLFCIYTDLSEYMCIFFSFFFLGGGGGGEVM